jgi:hypothetical protein
MVELEPVAPTGRHPATDASAFLKDYNVETAAMQRPATA